MENAEVDVFSCIKQNIVRKLIEEASKQGLPATHPSVVTDIAHTRCYEFWCFLHQITLNLHNFFTQPRGSDYLSTIYFTQENSKLFSYSDPK